MHLLVAQDYEDRVVIIGSKKYEARQKTNSIIEIRE